VGDKEKCNSQGRWLGDEGKDGWEMKGSVAVKEYGQAVWKSRRMVDR